MTSREIAELTGKQHGHVRRDIENMLVIGDEKYSAEESNWINHQNGVSYTEYILSSHLADLLLKKYQGLARVPHRLQEEAALKTIEQLFGISLVRQFPVLSYRVDGYCIESNTAYEIDEPHHKATEEQDSIRQREIESAIGCNFVRISL